MCDNLNTLNLNEWQKYIDNKKNNILDQIDKSNMLDNSIENKKFIEILKSIINCKIFNVSQFTFLSIKLLITYGFIDPQILLDILNNNINVNNSDNINNNNNPEPNLKNILKIIIEFIVKIEISLNYNCILIIHFLNKINNGTNNNKNETPDVFNIFSKIDNDITNSIKSSTIILLFLKFIIKLEKYENINKNQHIINNIIKFNDNNNTNNSITNINYNVKKSTILTLKIKMYLDTFMSNINNYFLNTNKTNTNIYSICIEYIICIVETLYNEFNYLFDILELCIILNFKNNNINFTDNKKKELENIKNEIKHLINNEINICKELFKN